MLLRYNTNMIKKKSSSKQQKANKNLIFALIVVFAVLIGLGIFLCAKPYNGIAVNDSLLSGKSTYKALNSNSTELRITLKTLLPFNLNTGEKRIEIASQKGKRIASSIKDLNASFSIADLFEKEGEENLHITVTTSTGRVLIEKDIVYIYDKTAPTITNIESKLNDIKEPMDNIYAVSTGENDIDFEIIISEKVELTFECPENEDLKICGKKEIIEKSKKIVLDVQKRNLDEKPVVFDIVLTDLAGNKTEHKFKIVRDGMGQKFL